MDSRHIRSEIILKFWAFLIFFLHIPYINISSRMSRSSAHVPVVINGVLETSLRAIESKGMTSLLGMRAPVENFVQGQDRVNRYHGFVI